MSGSHLPYFTSCADVLAKVYEFLDNELAEADCGKIQEHLDECGPCLKEFGLDQLVKDVVKRGCGCEPLPEDLRSKVMFKVREVQVQIAVVEETDVP
ncbi:MAG: mycothiol system anti-sigma-R factor [Sporichthyaceae bacterium]